MEPHVLPPVILSVEGRRAKGTFVYRIRTVLSEQVRQLESVEAHVRLTATLT